MASALQLPSQLRINRDWRGLGMLLTVPTTEYSRQIRSYRDEFLECADSMDGTGGLVEFIPLSRIAQIKANKF